MSGPSVFLGVGIALMVIGVVLIVIGRQTTVAGVSFGSVKVEGSTGLIVVMLGGASLVFSFVWNFADADNGGSDPSPTTTLAVAEPWSYGDDATFDDLWDSCADGDGSDCDELFWSSPAGSDYEWFGDTCGDRFAPGEVLCEEALG